MKLFTLILVVLVLTACGHQDQATGVPSTGDTSVVGAPAAPITKDECDCETGYKPVAVWGNYYCVNPGQPELSCLN